MQLTNLQFEKVKEIVSCYGKERVVLFKAPTGSGKTLMATSVIASLINDNPQENFIFVVATVSTSNLPQSFEQKINEYKSDLPVSDFEVEYIESPSNTKDNKSDSVPQIRIVRNKVYIFGKATFGKGRIFTEQSVISDFIQDCKTHGYKIVYIRDEAHIGAKSDLKDPGVKTFEELMNNNADFILKMTATFGKEAAYKRIELKESDLIDPIKNEGRWLIKDTPQKIGDTTNSDEELLDKAISEFKKVQKEYNGLDVIIRPAMLIQVDNEPTDIEKKQQFQSSLKMIKDKLKQAGLSWVQYFGDNDKDCSNVDNKNFTLSKITRNNDTTDCIIFKIGPATGWDIPRACMLLQLRNVCSSNLNIQTIGRIKRNPYPNLAKNPVTDKYYIFTNAPKDNETDFDIYKYDVKDCFEKEPLAVIKMLKEGKNVLDVKQLDKEISDFLTAKNKELLVSINECFDGGVYREVDKKLTISNPILLLKRIQILYYGLKLEFRVVLDKIKKVYGKFFKNIKWEQLEVVLLSYYSKDIVNIYRKCIPVKVKYKLELETIKPNTYTEIFEKSSDNIVDIADSNYIFEISKDGKNCNLQPLDSSNEEIVAEKLKTIFGLVGVKAWAKNQVKSNIFGEYLDDVVSERKSYFDFIIKFNNGNFLYLEVKGNEESDIDKEKTALLGKAYEDYFNNIEYGLFRQKIIICILKVDKSTKRVTPECFYDRTIIKTDLSGKPLEAIIKELNT